MIIAICEGRLQEQEKIEGFVKEYLKDKNINGEVYCYHSGESFLMDEGRIMFDIVLMDIFMPGKGGLSVARTLKKLNFGCEIIFISVSSDYAFEAYEIGAIHYILKPVTYNKLSEAIDRCQDKRTVCKNNKLIEVTVAREKILINQNRIHYIESQGKKTKIYTDFNEYQTWMPTNEIWQELDQESFVKLQRSYIANMDYVRGLKKDSCTLKNGLTINISRLYGKEIKEKYRKFVIAAARGEI